MPVRRAATAALSDKSVLQLTDSGLISPAPRRGLVLSQAFLLPKPNGTSRFIHDGRLPNAMLDIDKQCVLPSLQSVLDMMRGHSHLVSIDMSSWFFQFPLAHLLRRYFAFRVKSKGYFCMNRLPMRGGELCPRHCPGHGSGAGHCHFSAPSRFGIH